MASTLIFQDPLIKEHTSKWSRTLNMKFKVSSLIQGSLEGLEYVFGYSLHTENSTRSWA